MSNTIDRVLLWATRIGIFLVPFVPLIVASSLFFPFITGKGFAFRIIVEVIFACWLLLALRQPLYRPKQSLLLWGVLSFIGIVFLADVSAVNPFKAFWSNFERMEGFITMIHLGAYFLVVSAVFNTERMWHRLFATSVGVSAFLGIYGLLQLSGKIVINQGGVRLDGTFGNAAYFAGYMLFHIFLTLFLIFRHRLNPGIKWLYGATIFLQIFILIFTATRGAALGLIGGLTLSLLLIAFFEKNNKRIRVGAIGVFVALSVLVFGLYTARDTHFVKNNPALTRFASISASDAGPRFMVWGMAWEGFKEKPILGWGQEGFNHVFNKYYNPNMWAQEQWFDRTHNIFFDWLIAAGAPGLLAYLSLFGFLLWYIWKGKSTDTEKPFSFIEKSILTGLLASYVIHNFFVFDNLISYILFFTLIAFMHSKVGEVLPIVKQVPTIKTDQGTSTAGAILLVVLCGALYMGTFRPMSVALDLINGLRPQVGGVAENLTFYKKAFALETIGTQEVAEQAMQSAATVVAAPSVPEPIKAEFVSFALSALDREIKRVPQDTRLYVFMGGFLNRLGRYGEALPYLEKAFASSPTKQTVAFELSNTLLSTGKALEATKILKEAFERAPDFGTARVSYAAAAIYAQDFETAEKLFSSTTPVEVRTDERLVTAYYVAKQFSKVIELLLARLEKNPNDPQTHVSLAAAYLSSGSRNLAVTELQKAIELNPGFKDQGEFYIKEIRAGRNP